MSTIFSTWTTEKLLSVLLDLDLTVDVINDFENQKICKMVTKKLCHAKYGIKHMRELKTIWHTTDLKEKFMNALESKTDTNKLHESTPVINACDEKTSLSNSGEQDHDSFCKIDSNIEDECFFTAMSNVNDGEAIEKIPSEKAKGANENVESEQEKFERHDQNDDKTDLKTVSPVHSKTLFSGMDEIEFKLIFRINPGFCLIFISDLDPSYKYSTDINLRQICRALMNINNRSCLVDFKHVDLTRSYRKVRGVCKYSTMDVCAYKFIAVLPHNDHILYMFSDHIDNRESHGEKLIARSFTGEHRQKSMADSQNTLPIQNFLRNQAKVSKIIFFTNQSLT